MSVSQVKVCVCVCVDRDSIQSCMRGNDHEVGGA